MQAKTEYKLLIQIQSQYQVFDISGALPFSIVFGLHRRHSRTDPDIDPRPIVLDTAGSAFDVPYALKRGILRLCEHPGDKEVDTSGLTAEPAGSSYIELGPTVNSKKIHDRFTDYKTLLCPIAPEGEIASLLRPGTKYRIELASTALNVGWWAFGEMAEVVGGYGKPLVSPEEMELVSFRRRAGNAQFVVKTALSMPPRVDISLRVVQKQAVVRSEVSSVCSSGQSSTDINEYDRTIKQLSICIAETTLVNTASRPITFQCSGHQYFMRPWDPWQPSPDIDIKRTRLGHPDEQQGKYSLRIRNVSTDELVFCKAPQVRFGCGHQASPPRRDMLVTLEPGVPLVNRYDFGDVVAKLPDGTYCVELEPLGAWWSWGTMDDVCEGGDQVMRRLWYPAVVPLQLTSTQVVKFEIVGGRCLAH